MRKLALFLSILFLTVSVFGFGAKYYFHGFDDVYATQKPRHERITYNGFNFLCNKQNINFINNNLGKFLDNQPLQCDSYEFSRSLDSIKLGVKYNDAPEMDGFTGMDNNYYNDLKAAFITLKTTCTACAFFWSSGSPCPPPFILSNIDAGGISTVPGTSTPIYDLVTLAACGVYWSLINEDDFKISSEADLSKEGQYPLMHAQLNSRNFGKNPKIQINVMRNYIKSYFYELLMLSLTDTGETPINYFISYDDVNQHSSTAADDFIKNINYKKILMGELFHSIEDSFAHSLRYLDEIIITVNGKEEKQKVLKIGAMINMRSKLYDDPNNDDIEGNFNHGEDFGPMNWNCERVDDTANWIQDTDPVSVPLDLENMENINPDYFEYYMIDGQNQLLPFVKEFYASIMASHAIADFLWRLGTVTSQIRSPFFNGDYKSLADPEIDEYLKRWFTDGTDVFDPDLYDGKDENEGAPNDENGEDDEKIRIPDVYSEIVENAQWENFHNIDLWVESKSYDAVNKQKDAVFLPWIHHHRRYDVDNNMDRFVFKTIEDNKSHPDYNENSESGYDSTTKIITLKKSVLSIMGSWMFDLNGDKKVDLDMLSQEYFGDGSTEEKLVYTLPVDFINLERSRAPAAIFVPRGFRACLKFSTQNNEIQSFESNDAARFFTMPTYRCFYGGERGRLISGGKEDALKPGTQIYLQPVDMDGDDIIDWRDNCPAVYNPPQGDIDNDGIGNVCDPDIDGDGVPNEEDNCIYFPNHLQLDSDVDPVTGNPSPDGVGDACDACPYVPDNSKDKDVANYWPRFINGQIVKDAYFNSQNEYVLIDSDLDGVPDECDSCPFVPNPRIFASPHREIVVGPCDDPATCDGGAAFMESTRNGGKLYTQGSYYLLPQIDWVNKKYTYKYEYVITPFYGWQPDHDLDGIGDVCDYKSVTQNGQGIDTSRSPGTSTAKLGNVTGVSKTFVDPASQLLLTRRNSLYKVELLAAEWSEENKGQNAIILENTVHFCGMPDEEYYGGVSGSINWGKLGFCTNGASTVGVDYITYTCPYYPAPGTGCTPTYHSETEVKFGYSHGTDPAVEASYLQDYKPWTHIAWKKDSVRAERITAENIANARIPVWAMQGNSNGPNIGNCIPALGNSGVGCSVYPYWNWRMDAVDYMECDSNVYALCNQLEHNSAEAKPFHYALSAGALGEDSSYISWSQTGRTINPGYFYNKKKYARSFRNSMNDDIAFTFTRGPEQHYSIKNPAVFKNSHLPLVDSGVKKISQWQTPDVKFRQFNKNLPEGYYALTSGHSNALYAVTRNEAGYFELYINYAEDINDWHFITAIPSWPEELELKGLDMVGDSLYFAGIDKGERGSPFRIYRFNMNPAVMATTIAGELETPLDQARIFELNGGMYLSGIKEGSLSIYSFDKNTIIEKAQLPVRIDYTITVDGSSVYIAGGTNENQVAYSDILVSRDGGTNWETFADLGNYQMNLSKSFVHFSGGRMFIINPDADVDSNVKKVASIDLETGETVIEMTVPDGISFEYDSNLCVYENNGSIFPGSIGYDGGCIPVYNYNYQTVSYLDYKYTVAGFGSNLYLGGLTGVRRVEIRNDGSLVNSDMLYTGETNNLAVYGSTMYGANYGEIDVYSIADNGSISRTRGISSSSCGNVRVYDDKLYTAENKRVRIFDLTDPQNPLLVKTITTAGKVIDLEVVGETLYIYEETTSWFTTKGFTGIYDISNLNLPVRTKYFEKRCTDAEMQRSGNNSKDSLDEKVYLGCKNGQHRVTDTGLVSVSGEKNYVREGYLYDKVLYQVFSGALHRSKAAPFFAVCGNGIIEPGETCDGNFAQCTDVSSSYISGIAACNSTCDGYNTSDCESDGW